MREAPFIIMFFCKFEISIYKIIPKLISKKHSLSMYLSYTLEQSNVRSIVSIEQHMKRVIFVFISKPNDSKNYYTCTLHYHAYFSIFSSDVVFQCLSLFYRVSGWVQLSERRTTSYLFAIKIASSFRTEIVLGLSKMQRRETVLKNEPFMSKTVTVFDS